MYTCFYKQLHFLLKPQVAYGRMNFQPESFLLIHFQPLVTQHLPIFNKFVAHIDHTLLSHAHHF